MPYATCHVSSALCLMLHATHINDKISWAKGKQKYPNSSFWTLQSFGPPICLSVCLLLKKSYARISHYTFAVWALCNFPFFAPERKSTWLQRQVASGQKKTTKLQAKFTCKKLTSQKGMTKELINFPGAVKLPKRILSCSNSNYQRNALRSLVLESQRILYLSKIQTFLYSILYLCVNDNKYLALGQTCFHNRTRPYWNKICIKYWDIPYSTEKMHATCSGRRYPLVWLWEKF